MPVHPAVKMGWLLLACVVGWLGITGSVVFVTCWLCCLAGGSFFLIVCVCV
jgi:hypothetical protein